MNNIIKLAVFSHLSILCSCGYIGDKAPSLNEVEMRFISESQIMSEQETLLLLNI